LGLELRESDSNRFDLWLVLKILWAKGIPPYARDKKQRSSRFSLFQLFHFLFHVLDFNTVFADIETQVGVNAHILICDPDQREKGDEVAAPVIEKKLVVRKDEKKRRDVMAEAEFAGEEEEKLAARGVGMALTLADAIFAGLAEDFFMRDGPGDAGDGERERKKPYELQRERHS
jgi:hypothetical protein